MRHTASTTADLVEMNVQFDVVIINVRSLTSRECILSGCPDLVYIGQRRCGNLSDIIPFVYPKDMVLLLTGCIVFTITDTDYVSCIHSWVCGIPALKPHIFEVSNLSTQASRIVRRKAFIQHGISKPSARVRWRSPPLYRSVCVMGYKLRH